MLAIRLKIDNTYLLEIMLIEGNKALRLSVYYSLLKLNSQINLICYEETMKVKLSTELMGFLMSVRGDILFNCGQSFAGALISCPLLPLLITEFCACMEV